MQRINSMQLQRRQPQQQNNEKKDIYKWIHSAWIQCKSIPSQIGIDKQVV